MLVMITAQSPPLIKLIRSPNESLSLWSHMVPCLQWYYILLPHQLRLKQGLETPCVLCRNNYEIESYLSSEPMIMNPNAAALHAPTWVPTNARTKTSRSCGLIIRKKKIFGRNKLLTKTKKIRHSLRVLVYEYHASLSPM